MKRQVIIKKCRKGRHEPGIVVIYKFALYFFEVCTGEQTLGFHPHVFVDITDTQEIKRKSVYCHVSQDPPGIYGCGHAAMEDFRGRELGVKAAEGFVQMTGKLMGGFAV